MIQRMWPGGVQPETAQPYIALAPRDRGPGAPRVDDDRRRRPRSSSTCRRRARRSATRPKTVRTPRWRLYTGPIRVDGPMTLRAKAIRYGYKESAEAKVVFTPKEPPAR